MDLVLLYQRFCGCQIMFNRIIARLLLLNVTQSKLIDRGNTDLNNSEKVDLQRFRDEWHPYRGKCM